MARRARLASRDPGWYWLMTGQPAQSQVAAETARGANPKEPGRRRLRGRSALALPSSLARGRRRPAARRAGLTASGHRCCPARLQAWVTSLTSMDPELADLGTYRKK